LKILKTIANDTVCNKFRNLFVILSTSLVRIYHTSSCNGGYSRAKI